MSERTDKNGTLLQLAWTVATYQNGMPDITALAQDVAKLMQHNDWASLRDDIMDALDDESEVSHGVLGHDARGLWEKPDGELVAWWHTNAYSEWMLFADCDDDQRAELGVDRMGQPLEA